jgi:hypothetical protein
LNLGHKEGQQMSQIVSWAFPPRGRQKWRDPVTEEFFANSDLLTDISSLVRESIQNSLDARLDKSKPVRVIMKIAQNDMKLQVKYFGGLQNHLDACEESGIGYKVDAPGRYLVVEDFNTIGLGGDVTLAEVPNGKREGWGYTFFAHMEGAGNRRTGGLGTWGVGKVVFPKLSRIKAFFALSVRSPEHSFGGPQRILFGQSILKFHQIGPQTFQPDGWFAEDVAPDVYGPVDPEVIDPFTADFGLRRTNDLGLSLVVPHIPESVSVEKLRDAVIRQYFVAILSSSLEVEIEDQGKIIVLNSSTLETEVKNLTMDGAALLDQSAQQMSQNIEICKAFFDDGSLGGNAYELDIRGGFTASTFTLPEDLKTSLRKSLEGGSVAGLKISMPLAKAEMEPGADSSAHLWVLLKRNDGVRVSPTYSRQGILVPGKSRSLSDHIPLVLVQEGKLAELLALAEGPAHESWDAKSKGFVKKYGETPKHEAQLVNAVRQLPHWIVGGISAREGEQDLKAMAEWFPKKSDGKGDPLPPPPPPPPPTPKQPSVLAYPKGAGFVIKNAQTKLPKGTRLTVQVAYAVSAGNPFTSWSKLDFDFESSFEPLKTSVDVELVSGNVFTITVLKEEWEFELQSLLTLRDLELDIQFWHEEQDL